MAVLLKPNARVLDRDVDDAISADAAAISEGDELNAYAVGYVERPGITGIRPVTLVFAMLMGAGMWAGILYLGYAALNWVF